HVDYVRREGVVCTAVDAEGPREDSAGDVVAHDRTGDTIVEVDTPGRRRRSSAVPREVVLDVDARRRRVLVLGVDRSAVSDQQAGRENDVVGDPERAHVPAGVGVADFSLDPPGGDVGDDVVRDRRVRNVPFAVEGATAVAGDGARVVAAVVNGV